MPANSEIRELGPGNFIQAYESARAGGRDIELTQFLPPPDHPFHAEVHRELLARDRAYRAGRDRGAKERSERTVWNRGKIGSANGAFHGPASRSAGASNLTDQVLVRIQMPDEVGAQTPLDLESDTAPVRQSVFIKDPIESASELPAPGTEFLGFQILGELGHGAFGCVYLARQHNLASRLVALKVSTDIQGESQALAQLQHTNIVPIYSVHRSGPFQAVCMPYFGAITVADLLRHWRDRQALPESGKDLVSTLFNRKTSTRPASETLGDARSPSGEPRPLRVPSKLNATNPALPPLGEPQGTAILEMLEGLSFVEAVLWIASRLVDGLAHAHERGILHRDLKPANVLLTDEGQPMLLDFSVAEDTKRRTAASISQIGGTVCYMAPEHLEAFHGVERNVDARSDLYSLGIILYEMLTRRDPFPIPTGEVSEILPRILEGRQGTPPRLRCWNRAVSPAAESIVRHCLVADPAKRYQSAHELREDLERHRANLPLLHAPEPSIRERSRKWMRRHPRLASLTTLAVLSAALVCSVIGWWLVHGFRLAELEARDTQNRFHEETKTVQFLLNARSMDSDQLDKGLRLGRHALAIYHVLDNSNWEQESAVRRLSEENRVRLRTELEDLLLVMSRATILQSAAVTDPSEKESHLRAALHMNELAEPSNSDERPSQALLAQRAEMLELLGDPSKARIFRERAAETPLCTPRDYFLAGAEQVAQGRYGDALPLLQHAAEQDPQNFWAQLLVGICYDGLSRDAEARACYTTCIALWPEFPWTYFNRGLAYLRQNDYAHAIADFDRVIRIQPDFAEVYMNRALAHQGTKHYSEAVEDLTHALDLGAPYARIFFMRSRARDLADDKEGARRDLAEGLRREPTDEKSWIARGVARISSDMPGALADFERAAESNPRSLAALQNQAHVLSKLNRTEKAIKMLDREIELYPDYVPARAGRGVLLAREGKRRAAHEDAEEALARDFGSATQYQVAGIFALTSQTDPEDRKEALRYLSSALRKGYGFEFLDQDKDLDPIRESTEFRRLLEATKAFQAATPKSQGERPPR
jgi:serine/threonine protein kinase/Tfp pilus assembly protein PilF